MKNISSMLNIQSPDSNSREKKVDFAHFTSLAIGKFDGMHRAHQQLFTHLDTQGALLCVRNKKSSIRELTPIYDMQQYSPCPIIMLELNEVKDMDAQHFINWLKENFTNLKRLVVGYDFRFGRQRAYGAYDLQKLFVGEVIIMPEYCLAQGEKLENIGVHSRFIRDFLAQGDMFSCLMALGRYYHIRGHVISGQGIGAKQLYATLNLECNAYVLPQNGVYASFVRIGKEKTSRIYLSVSFIGNRFSTDGAFSIESHILDSEFVLEERYASICFVQKIRDNAKFTDLNMLKERISMDITESTKILQAVCKADIQF